jgi:selenoprotein W-related protein
MVWAYLAPPTYIAALRQKGIPTNEAECAELYERGPREENGFRHIFAAADQVSSLSQEMKDLVPFAGRANWPMPAGPLPHAMGQITTEYVQANAEALETLKRALEFPRIRAPIIFDGWMKLPHLTQVRSLMNLLALETLSHIYAGRPEETTNSLINLFRLTLSTADQHFLYEGVRNALITFETAAGRVNFTQTQLRRLQDHISQDQFQEFNVTRSAILGQAYMYLEEQNALYSNIGSRHEVTQKEYIAVSLGLARMRACGVGLFDRLTTVTHLRQLVEIGNHMDAKTLGTQIDLKDMHPTRRAWFANRHSYFRIFYITEAENVARARAALVVCAIERYQLDHEDILPDRLDALVPEYLEQIPLDPFDDRPLRYQFIEDYGYMIYSVGYDLDDDRGWMNEGSHFRGGDIVTAVYPLPREERMSSGKPARIPSPTETDMLRVEIEYGKGARALRRASSLAQELLSSFPTEIREVALQPGDAGAFEVSVNGMVIWSRKGVGRFPAGEELKQHVRNLALSEHDPSRIPGWSTPSARPR